MKSSAKHVKLATVDDLFSTEESRQEAAVETVRRIALSELRPFPNHPFAVRDDDSMKETVESVREYGVLVPAIARPHEGGGYELISGHRRKHACELAGLDTMPVIVRDMDDDTAIIYMVDSNLQRENILLSEKAQAYKMKMDAIRRRSGRRKKEEIDSEKNGVQVGHHFEGKKSIDVVAEESGESRSQIQRFIRLTELDRKSVV